MMYKATDVQKEHFYILCIDNTFDSFAQANIWWDNEFHQEWMAYFWTEQENFV